MKPLALIVTLMCSSSGFNHTVALLMEGRGVGRECFTIFQLNFSPLMSCDLHMFLILRDRIARGGKNRGKFGTCSKFFPSGDGSFAIRMPWAYFIMTTLPQPCQSWKGGRGIFLGFSQRTHREESPK